MKLVFATNNQHKLDEVRKITAGYAEIISLSDIDCHDDIPETADTLEGNALLKADHKLFLILSVGSAVRNKHVA